MKKSLAAILAASLCGGIAAAPASAAPKLCDTAYNQRQAVVKKHGKRAPGRNICRFGVQSKFNSKWSKPATTRQKASYVRALRALNAPAPFLLARTAVAPGQPPAGTLSASVRAPAGGILARIRACESGGNYATNTGNGFYGAYQFDQQTWNSVGGSGSPANASPAEQDARAAKLYAQRGASPWPVCGR